MDSYCVMIREGISCKDVEGLCHLLSMYNIRRDVHYIEIFSVSYEQIKKLASLLDVLEVDYFINKNIDIL